MNGAHPRVCGENDSSTPVVDGIIGSSPRVRGKRGIVNAARTVPGLIPACAGKTYIRLAPQRLTRAHPRVCGENATLDRANARVLGSSPRVRGKPPLEIPSHTDERLIPACAGKTQISPSLRGLNAAHPRVCGENCIHETTEPITLGSSPRVRGKQPAWSSPSQKMRLIPACAGKTPNLERKAP